MPQGRAAELDILVGMVAIGAGDVQKQILGRDTRSEPAVEVVAHGLADPEPGLAGGQGIEQVGSAEAARRAVERAGAAGMRVGACHHGARQGIGVIGDDNVADPLVGADIVHPADAEAPRKLAPAHMHRRAVAVRGRHIVIEHDDDLVGIVHLQHLAPRTARERQVDHHDEIDIDNREIARCDLRGAAGPCQDLFGDCHAHRHRSRTKPAISCSVAPSGEGTESVSPSGLVQ